MSRPEVPHDPWINPRATRLPPGGVVVPLEMVSNMPFVAVRINGHGPYRMVLDTGGGALWVTPKVAEALGLPRSEDVSFRRGARPGAPDVKVVRVLGRLVQSLEIGAARFERIHAQVIDAPHLVPVVGEYDGIVGLPVFHDCQLTIDYPARQARVGFGRLPPPDGRDVIPIDVANPGDYPFTALKVAGRHNWFLIDSGYNRALNLPASAAARARFAHAPVPRPFRGYTVYGRPDDERTGRLAGGVRLGRHAIASPVVDVTPGKEFGMLGGEVLRHFVVTINVKSHAMRLTRTGRGPITSAPLRYLGFSARTERDAWVVIEAAAGTSLEQLGLREGDRVIAVNGRPVSELPPDAGAFLPAAGSATYAVERDGEQFDLTLPVTTVVP